MRGSRAAGGDGGAADWRAGGSRSQMPAITDESTSPPDSDEQRGVERERRRERRAA